LKIGSHSSGQKFASLCVRQECIQGLRGENRRKRQRGRPKQIWEDNIKTEKEVVDCMDGSNDRDKG